MPSKRFPRKTTVRVDEAGYEKVKRISEYLGVSMAEVIRDAISDTTDLGKGERMKLEEMRAKTGKKQAEDRDSGELNERRQELKNSREM